MSEYKAQRILDIYSDEPETREDRVSLIRVCYQSLRGKPFHQCKDSQIGAVANRLHEEALNIIEKKIPFKHNKKLIEQAGYDYFQHLNLIFGEEGVATSELERRLLDY